MPRFAANLSLLFTEVPLIERFAEARAAGFEAVEVLFPYDTSAAEIGQALSDNALSLVLINAPPPNYTGGDRGFAAVPGLEDRFAYDLRRAVRYAGALGAEFIHIMAGVAEGDAAKETFIANLRHATASAPRQSFTIEPISAEAMPGYFLNNFDLACEALDAVDAPNLHLQFDAFHAHSITGDVLGTWDKVNARVAHVQIAGPAPDRHEPSDKGIDYPAFFARLDADGYDGWVSAEYKPAGRTVDGLGWRNL